jgi:hypothetical protein
VQYQNNYASLSPEDLKQKKTIPVFLLNQHACSDRKWNTKIESLIWNNAAD